MKTRAPDLAVSKKSPASTPSASVPATLSGRERSRPGMDLLQLVKAVIDNSPRQLQQRVLTESIRSSGRARTGARPSPTQLKKVQDYGAQQTKLWYAQQIADTNTAAELEGVVKSVIREGSGVFLSDNIYEMEHWLKAGTDNDVSEIVVPNLDEIKDMSGFPPSFRDNGLSTEQNCAVIAEHELVHLKHASANSKRNIKGAGTGVREFDFGNFEATITALSKSAKELPTYRSHADVTRLVNSRAYVVERIDYIWSTWTSRKTNAEAPAVLRELSRYLVIVVREDDEDAWKDFRSQVQALDRTCAEAVDMPPAKGRCFLTTACTQARGLPDDCRELTLLRRFRDGYLRALPQGAMLTTVYYAHAPVILDSIGRRDDAGDILESIYRVVESCADAIEGGDNESGLREYCNLMLVLMAHFRRMPPRGGRRAQATQRRLRTHVSLGLSAESPVARLRDKLATCRDGG